MKSFFLILVLIPLSLQIDHCLIEKPICQTCKTGYYLSNGECITIENCEKFSSYDNTCDSCKAGYRPSEDKKSCIVIGKDHCYFYTMEMMERLKFVQNVSLDIKRTLIIHVK